MKLKQLFTDEDAVSPVIGVILMVAITVILAAVIGTFVLGLGDQVSDSAPQASFTFDYSDTGTDQSGTDLADTAGNGELTITHDGGDTIDNTNLEITDGSGTTIDDSNQPAGGNWFPADVSAGDDALVVVDDDDTVRVIWNAGDSATLGKWSGPEA